MPLLLISTPSKVASWSFRSMPITNSSFHYLFRTSLHATFRFLRAISMPHAKSTSAHLIRTSSITANQSQRIMPDAKSSSSCWFIAFFRPTDFELVHVFPVFPANSSSLYSFGTPLRAAYFLIFITRMIGVDYIVVIIFVSGRWLFDLHACSLFLWC